MIYFEKVIEYLMLNPSVSISLGMLLLFGLVAKVFLFVKCGKPAWAGLIPVYDLVVLLKIVGRPAVHIWLFLIPVYNLYLVAKVLIELAKSFGKHNAIDHALILIFNIFYVMNLGLAYNENYYGPSYNTPKAVLKDRKVPMYA